MTNLLFRDNMLVNFFIVFCGFFSVVSLLRINKLENDIADLNTQVITISQYLERSLNQIKYLREDYSDQHHDLKHEVFNKIETLEVSLTESFQKERIQLEEAKATKTKDTFKNLKAAFSPVDVKIEKDNN